MRARRPRGRVIVFGILFWYPLAGLVSDWILFRAIGMCLTGRVSWRGTDYGPGTRAERPVSHSQSVTQGPG